MKKQLLLLVTLIMPIAALADASGTCGTNLTWAYKTVTKTLSFEGSGDMANYNSSTATPWNSFKDEIERVIIGPNATSIGKCAFSGLNKLTDIYIHGTVTSIGEEAFNKCTSLPSITIPNSVTSIGKSAFSGCSALVSVNISNGVTSIEDYTFNYCSSLTSITIPNSVLYISDNAFAGCSGLTSIYVDSGNTRYDSRDNCKAIIETYTNTLILGCKNTFIPNNVRSIDIYAFFGCTGLTSINIPNSVISIGYRAFQNCTGLTSITIPNSVTSIGGYAFSGCTNLVSVIIGNNVTYIGEWAFSSCSGLTNITIPGSVTSIGKWVFYGCSNITSIIVNEENTKYDSRNNSNAIIETATNTLLVGCKNTIIPNSVTSIGEAAFYTCTGLTSYTIPNSVTSIGRYAFAGSTNLMSINIGNGVTNIKQYAFYGCSSLASVIIGNSLTSIDDNAFTSCNELQHVYCYADQPPTVTTKAFPTNYTKATLHVPTNMVYVYLALTPWKDFGNIVALTDDDPKPTNVVDVKRKMFADRGAFYDINGRKMTGTPTQKGIYINNGHKMIVK